MVSTNPRRKWHLRAGLKPAGLIGLTVNEGHPSKDWWCLYLLVKPSCWTWGFERIEYDQLGWNFGIGPLFTLGKMHGAGAPASEPESADE